MARSSSLTPAAAVIESVNVAIGKWLDHISNAVVQEAETHKRARKMRIRAQRKGMLSTLTVEGKDAATLAIDRWLTVPPGGFAPVNAKAFTIVKPWGEVVLRSRTYTKYAGQTIRMRGFMSLALDKKMNKSEFQELAESAGRTSAIGLANEIVSELRKRGIIASTATYSVNATTAVGP